MKTILIMILAFLLGLKLTAQQTGKVDYPDYGISFTIPDGWIGQELEEAYLMASNQDAGIIIFLFHPAKTREELSNKLRQELSTNGVQLRLIGDLQTLTANIIEGQYQGTVNYEKAKGHVFGLRNLLIKRQNDNLSERAC